MEYVVNGNTQSSHMEYRYQFYFKKIKMTCSGCNGFWLRSVTAGSLWEWKGILIRNVGFSLDMATLLMALGHYVHIWWLHGMAFHLMDSVLFLNICVNISFWHSMSCSIYNHLEFLIRPCKVLCSSELKDSSNWEKL